MGALLDDLAMVEHVMLSAGHVDNRWRSRGWCCGPPLERILISFSLLSSGKCLVEHQDRAFEDVRRCDPLLSPRELQARSPTSARSLRRSR